ncbi:MAG: hypothetical protein WHU54_09185 [Candidatus Bathyarchaeia archaeon]
MCLREVDCPTITDQEKTQVDPLNTVKVGVIVNPEGSPILKMLAFMFTT